jgi:hypothetical protein
MDSILNAIKKLLGIQSTDTNFDQEIIMHINSVFTVLNQLGIGPTEGFAITDDDDIWDDFLETHLDLELVKSYMYLKVRLMFDPPQNSFLVKAIEDQIQQFEWRLQVQAEPYSLTAEEAALEEEEEDLEITGYPTPGATI